MNLTARSSTDEKYTWMEPYNRIEEVRNNRIASNIHSYVVSRVVSSHVLLVDIFLKDIAQHTAVHLALMLGLAIIEMALVGVEECKEPFKGYIWYLDGRVALLQWMRLKEIVTQVRNFAEQGL